MTLVSKEWYNVLINDEGRYMVEFVRYTGRYPCMCLGDLTVAIDHKLVTLNNALCSSGDVVPSDDWRRQSIAKGPWKVDIAKVPGEHKSRVDEIEACVNRHVPFGCCGGCL